MAKYQMVAGNVAVYVEQTPKGFWVARSPMVSNLNCYGETAEEALSGVPAVLASMAEFYTEDLQNKPEST